MALPRLALGSVGEHDTCRGNATAQGHEGHSVRCSSCHCTATARAMALSSERLARVMALPLPCHGTAKAHAMALPPPCHGTAKAHAMACEAVCQDEI